MAILPENCDNFILPGNHGNIARKLWQSKCICVIQYCTFHCQSIAAICPKYCSSFVAIICNTVFDMQIRLPQIVTAILWQYFCYACRLSKRPVRLGAMGNC